LGVQQVVDFRDYSGLKILAVGYTVYLGSEYESEMLHQAARIVFNAHQHGLITVLWIYPRGKAVADEKDPHLIAGATGVAACLGSDFVKVNYPKKEGYESKEIFEEAVTAAGRTKVVCAGGSSDDVEVFLKRLHDQIHVSGASGNATGRNIHQKSLKEAIRMCNAIYAITVDGETVNEAMKIYTKV
jgi:DhnA family fructose-bisphosphate aldolase class Ia